MKNLLTLAFVLLAAACGGRSHVDPTPATATTVQTTPATALVDMPSTTSEVPPRKAKTATALLTPTAGHNVTGTITFNEADDGLEVTAMVENLTPGDHAWHIHEKGDCSAPDATSAGGHFNPGGHQHGPPDGHEHHAGDLGNLSAGKDGKATRTMVMKGITLDDGAKSIVGKGFIVHEKNDDFKTQPTGNAGGRVACGVIKLDT